MISREGVGASKLKCSQDFPQEVAGQATRVMQSCTKPAECAVSTAGGRYFFLLQLNES